MQAVAQSIKLRLNTLNVIRTIIAVFIIGEGLHSGAYWLLAVALVLIVQVILNKTCTPESC
jgi:hypothetical protein